MSRFQKLLNKTNKTDFTEMEKGKQTEQSLIVISEASNNAFKTFEEKPQRFQELIKNPTLAKTNEEKIGVMGAREIIILIDKSGSMSGLDNNPQLESNTSIQKNNTWNLFNSTKQNSTTQKNNTWTLWDSAKIATESILELSLAVDKDHKIDYTTFPGFNEQGISIENYTLIETTNISDIQQMFSTYYPSGGTPLSYALQSIREQKLKTLLDNNVPFTVIIMTDGVPDNEIAVKDFFVNLIKDNRLSEEGRQYLAAFSFVQMGDNAGATQFLTDLDDNMEKYCKSKGVKYVDIIDTKKDNFLFGTDEYKNQVWKGPFALLYDAIFD